MTNEPVEPVRNRLLHRLQSKEYLRLRPHFKDIAFESGRIIYEARSQIDFVYFPHNCVLSAVTMLDGSGIEVGTIGNEGAAGLTAFIGPSISPFRVIAQVPGEGVCIAADILQEEAKNNRQLHKLLLQYHQAFLTQLSQTIACNGLHSLLKRCCRWLLMTQDRVGKDELQLTHEFLSFMLGVRRSTVSETLQALQEQNLIATSRGSITIINRTGLEAASCKCYQIVVEEYARLLGST